MLIRRTEAGLRVWAPAKVNLFLEVLRRRMDGYHELTTLMLAVGLYDDSVAQSSYAKARIPAHHP